MILSTLFITCLFSHQLAHGGNDTYLYVDPDFPCVETVNLTLNHTCDGSEDYPFNTIQDALDVSHGGTVIYLNEGVYEGEGNINLTIYDIYSRIYSLSNDYSNTIIDCNYDGFGIAYNKGTFLLSGITIQNCIGIIRSVPYIPLGNNGSVVVSNNDTAIGGALWIENGYALIKNVYLNNNEAQLGGGIYTYSSTVEFEGSIIANNEATVEGGGIYVNNGYLSLNHSSGVVSNTAPTAGGISITKATVELDRGSYLSYNKATSADSDGDAYGNQVLCYSGAGILLDSSYVSAQYTGVACDNFEDGDAVCYSDCAVVYKVENVSVFDYCDYEIDYAPCTTTTMFNDSDSMDDSSEDSSENNNGTVNGGTSGVTSKYSNDAMMIVAFVSLIGLLCQ